MIELRDVRYTWPHAASDCLAIDTLSVGAARTLFLHGPSGAGKSTLLGLLAGVLRKEKEGRSAGPMTPASA